MVKNAKVYLFGQYFSKNPHNSVTIRSQQQVALVEKDTF
jgi:hypothetical protein